MTEKEKNKFRKEKIKQLKEVPYGQKIHMDKEELEELIFDTVTVELNEKCGDLCGKKVKVKYPVCTGHFLRNVDLSEVSFDDVIWEWNYEPDQYFKNEDSSWKFSSVEKINLSKTNAKIDFSKSFAGKLLGHGDNTIIPIVNCNFTGIDLSNNALGNDYGYYLSSCSFKNSGIDINLNSEHEIVLKDCDFSFLDFSKYTVDEKFFGSFNNPSVSEYCNYANTLLNIKIDKLDDMDKKRIVEELDSGHFYNCYINNCLVINKGYNDTEKEFKSLSR